jgi:TPR repeat protein
MSAPVFLSFASKDRSVALTICEALEHRGVKCWISCRDIHPGENFQVAIVHAIRAAKVMVLVFSANANNSEEIKKELVLAGQSKLVVMPVRVEDISPDDAFAYEFATRQWIDLFVDWEHSIQALIDQLENLAGVTPQSISSAEPAPTTQIENSKSAPQRHRMNRSGIAAFCACVLAVLVAGWLWRYHYAPNRPASPVAMAPNPVPAPVPTPPPVPVPLSPSPAPVPVPPAGSPTPQITAAEAVAKGEEAEKNYDYATALSWYRQAADQGNDRAQFDLGALYQSGLGVAQDYAQAMAWYQKSAAQGNARAEEGIGFFYQRGEGVPQDYTQAMTWYRKAAAQNNAVAQNNIGLLYANGWGVARDYAEAMRWFRLAADQGYAPAEWTVGSFYTHGVGVPRDPVQGRIWIKKAAAQNYENAKRWLAANPS